jgi:hypothetical protein
MSTGRDWSLLKEDTSMEGVAGCALYLLSPIGRSITGEVVHVDAGFHIVGVPGHVRTAKRRSRLKVRNTSACPGRCRRKPACRAARSS